MEAPFWGLQPFPMQDLRLDKSFFSCCSGTGKQLVADNLYLCRLQQRLTKLEELLSAFKNHWGDGYDKFWQRKLQPMDMSKLYACASGERRSSGRMLVSAKAAPSYLWLVAAAAVWRFGLHVHFVSIMTKSHDGLIPAQRHDDTVVMVENHVSTVHPENVVDCETIINYCYNTETPLWLDFTGVVNKTNRKLNFRLREKLRKLQNRHPLTNFGRSGRDKLLEIV
ncbi:MAG: hypothetical protein OYH77_03315 [Pseudomonadota bacterium]|nr:hypothetical protein [Pseudomonadota bacterium]